ncbi:uncharacterized protein TNCT_677831 [Trichonephila clavata]|uniref:DUF7041 domain-containing protein n=1 Tax=Trichonephila clavata TaxID=2740835 RepID=A0A8X6G680_TRICU|nr:uncharacterized protein TNCT_677831 [Trichonephila clavata]
MEDISAVKIPAFVSSDPALWFGKLESTFELAIPKPITDERTKYNYCVAHLSPDAAMAVRDVILSPGSTNPYSKLKEEVIARCGESKSQEIRRLLAGEQLGDRKPSELFRVMQRRSESQQCGRFTSLGIISTAVTAQCSIYPCKYSTSHSSKSFRSS